MSVYSDIYTECYSFPIFESHCWISAFVTNLDISGSRYKCSIYHKLIPFQSGILFSGVLEHIYFGIADFTLVFSTVVITWKSSQFPRSIMMYHIMYVKYS